MVFSSIFFIFVFLPILILMYFVFPNKYKNLILLLGSLVFYGWGEPKYILLMILSILFNYFTVITFTQYERYTVKRRRLFIFTIVCNLLILGLFKYSGFIVDNLNSILSTNIEFKALSLPIGISFYTFQMLSYVIDAYLDKIKTQRNIISFALYVTMFPQLVAGPIVQYFNIEKQLDHREENLEKFGHGVERFIQGLAKKVLIANNIGLLWTTISSTNLNDISVLTAWIGIIAFTMQIYFDFSGYSDMAIGLGKMFGFDFIENFNYPYIATSITEFWRRWHISLGSWFREYIYIPLGGNRCTTSRHIVNLGIVWLLTGLWHGASWNFVLWGAYYGFILLLEKIFLKNMLKKCPKFIKHVYTLLLVIIGWVFFSLENLNNCISYLQVMFGLGGNSIIDSNFLYFLSTNIILLIISILFSTPLPKKIYIAIRDGYSNKFAISALLIEITLLVVSIAYLVSATYNPFLYFRF